MTYRPDCAAFRVLLIEPSSRCIYIEKSEVQEARLPTVSIPRWSRVAPHLQAAITRLSGIPSIVLDFAACEPGFSPLVVAQTTSHVTHNKSAVGIWVPYERLSEAGIGDQVWDWIERLLSTGASGRGFYSRFDWHCEVLKWIHSVVPNMSSAQLHVEQLNASSNASLLCIRDKDGKKLWFKSNAGEYDVSLQIARSFPAYVPPVLAHRLDWAAWLMGDGGSSFALASNLTPARLTGLGLQLASLQLASRPFSSKLSSGRLQDLRTAVLRTVIPEILQDIAKARADWTIQCSLRSLEGMLLGLLDEWEEIGVPDVLSHTDLNLSNILTHRGRCVFIDWADAAVANPFTNFIQIKIQLSRLGISPAVLAAYSESYLGEWSAYLNTSQLNRALGLSPAIATLTRLGARRHWLTSGAAASAERDRCSNHMLKKLLTTLAGLRSFPDWTASRREDSTRLPARRSLSRGSTMSL